MKFIDYKINNFIDDLSSDLPSPGGGSVAGLVAALAGSLNSMVYSLTVNKKAFDAMDMEDKKLVLDFKEASKKFTLKALNSMEKDREAFNKLMDCYKMKKDTEEEKEVRKKVINEKTLGAMLPPYELLKECYKFYDNIDIAIKYGNKMLISDAICAAILLHASIEAAIENVKINLYSLSNKEYIDRIDNEIKDILSKSLILLKTGRKCCIIIKKREAVSL